MGCMSTDFLGLPRYMRDICALQNIAGVEEAVSHWPGKILQTWTYMCGKQGYLHDLENMMYKSYCAKHNQHVKHANARGVWGHAPPGNF